MTSAVTRTPAAFAARSTATVCGRRHVADVQPRPGLAGQRAVAGDDRLLRRRRPPGQPELRRDDALVRLRARGEPVVLGVLGDHRVERRGVLQRPAHDDGVVHAPAVVGEHPHPGAGGGHRAELGHPLAREPDGDGADRVHVDQPDLLAEAVHVLDDDGGVGHRVRVRASRRPRCSRRGRRRPSRWRRSRTPHRRVRAGGCAGRRGRAAARGRRRRGSPPTPRAGGRPGPISATTPSRTRTSTGSPSP